MTTPELCSRTFRFKYVYYLICINTACCFIFQLWKVTPSAHNFMTLILLNLLNLLYILTQVLIAACLENESFKKTSLLVFRETLLTFVRNNHRLCSVRKSVLRNFAKFKGKHPCQSPFLIKLQASLSTLLKKKLCHRCFPANFVKFLRAPFLQNISLCPNL